MENKIIADIGNFLVVNCWTNNDVKCFNCANKCIIDGQECCFLGYVADMIEGKEKPLNKKRSWNK